MSATAMLKEAIQARKFRKMEKAGQFDQKVREIQNLLGRFPLAKISEIQMHLIAKLAGEAAVIQDEYLRLEREIELAERELT